MPRRAGGGGGGGGDIEPRYQSDTTLESSIAKSEAMGSLISRHCFPVPIPVMLLKPQGPSAIFNRQSGLGRLQCVRGERVQGKEGGSHIFSRLFRALHSRGRLPDSSFM